jgi:hypothetical protein
MTRITINHHYYSQVFGATIAGPIWKNIMTAALKGVPIERFEKPNGSVTKSDGVNVPDVTGKSVDQAKGVLTAAGFLVQTATALAPSKFPAGSVASTDPSGGTKLEKGSEVTITISSGGGGNQPGGKSGGNGGKKKRGGGGIIGIPGL